MKNSYVTSKLLVGLVLIFANEIAISAEVKVSNKSSTYEEMLTPLLKDIGKKNAVLEVKKIELELKKTNNEMEKLDDPNYASGMDGKGSNNSNEMDQLKQKIQSLEMLSRQQQKINEESSIKVLSVSGFKDDLRAKVAIGKRSGYYVRAKDVLPDGSVVIGVESNYMIINQMGKRVMIPISPPESEKKEQTFNVNTMFQGVDSSITATPTNILQQAAQPIPASQPLMFNSR